jgi:hypothetical protein
MIEERRASCTACHATLALRKFRWGWDWAAVVGEVEGDGITCPELRGYLGRLPHAAGPYKEPVKEGQP